jgi:sarcosine oxidase subunit alpha
MCSENGFLFDDGVVARIDEQTWLCHTTSGGADRIHAHMEEWLQTEWWDWNVWVVNITEQLAQVGVVGPNARKLLEKLGGMDVSAETLPAGRTAFLFQVSFRLKSPYPPTEVWSFGRC